MEQDTFCNHPVAVSSDENGMQLAYADRVRKTALLELQLHKARSRRRSGSFAENTRVRRSDVIRSAWSASDHFRREWELFTFCPDCGARLNWKEMLRDL